MTEQQSTKQSSNIAVYPGSFDPVHYGHLDIIERASKQFDKLVVAVLNNIEKKPLFTIQERIDLLTKTTEHLPNVQIDSFRDLLIRYMESKQASVIVRGLRAVSDFEKELQMASLNRKLSEDVETFFMMTNPKYSYLSSSIVKEIAEFSGPVRDFVPKLVEHALIQKYENRS